MPHAEIELSMSNLKLPIYLILTILISSCSLYYHQSKIAPVDQSLAVKLAEQFGNGSFYRLSSGRDKIHKSRSGEILGADEQVELILAKSDICPSGFQILPETYKSYEYGVVTLIIKCATNS